MTADRSGDSPQVEATRRGAGSTSVPGTVCPFLGWQVDAETHHAYPSMANHCHTQVPPLTIELAYQASTCLEGDWAACPRYRAARSDGVLERTSANRWFGRTKGRRLPGWAVAGIALAALALLAGLFLILRPVISAQSSVAVTSGLTEASIPATPHAVVQSTSPPPTQAPLPTPSEAGPTGSQAPGVAGTPAQLGPLPTQSPTEASSPTPIPTLTATGSPTPISPDNGPLTGVAGSPTPPASATATQTATPTPTSTPTATLIPTATRRPRPTATPTRPAPSPTPAAAGSSVQFKAPVLLSPANGQGFSERDVVTLRWQGVGQLAPNEYYVPNVAYLRFGDTWFDDTPWTKDTSWALSEHPYLLGLSDNGEFRWGVRVMRRTGINAQGKPEGTALSPMSEVRTLYWRASSGGGAQPTGVAPPP